MGMKVLENTSLFFVVAIILGLAFPDLSVFTGGYVLLFFIAATTLSLGRVRISFSDIRKNAPVSLKTVLLSYGLLSAFTIAVAYMFLPGTDYLSGFIVMAAAPPAVVLIVFTYLLRGDTKASLGGEIINYTLALLFAPLITLAFIGSAVDVFEVLKILFLMILLPLVISRFIKRVPGTTQRREKIIINFCFALINYSIIGLNHSVIFSDLVSLGLVILVNTIVVFVPGTAIYLAGRKMGIPRDRCITYTLFGSIKNGGMSATLALLLLPAAASIPGALHGISTIAFFMFFEFLIRRC
jgi:BASS family bile acid:Na+ symporter